MRFFFFFFFFFESAGVASLRKLVRYSGAHVCIVKKQETSKKMCHLMFSVEFEKFAHVTCMLDDN